MTRRNTVWPGIGRSTVAILICTGCLLAGPAVAQELRPDATQPATADDVLLDPIPSEPVPGASRSRPPRTPVPDQFPLLEPTPSKPSPGVSRPGSRRQPDPDTRPLLEPTPSEPTPRTFLEVPKRSLPPVQTLPDAKLAEECHLIVYRLKHVQAKSILPMLESLVPEEDSPTLRLAIDENTNSVVIRATSRGHKSLAELIETLDVAPERAPVEEVRVFSLQNADPREVAEVISQVLGPLAVRIAADPGRRSLVVAGSPEALNSVEALVKVLDVAVSSGTSKAQTPRGYRVRVVWLVAGGDTNDETSKPADDLKTVVDELAKVGVKDLVQLGQTIVFTAVPRGRFQIQCPATLEPGLADLKIHGTLDVAEETPQLDIQVSAELFIAEPEQILEVELQTTIVAPEGHYVVLGATPMGRMSSVFVVQVTSGK